MRIVVTFALLLVASATNAQAASQAKGDEAPKEQANAQVAPKKLDAVVRGLFVEARVGAGYMVVNDKLEATPVYPDIGGQSESLGSGSFVSLGLGYDLTGLLALQLLGGATLASGTRSERVRDLALLYGGAALRVSVGLSERLRFIVAGGGGFGRADNGVEAATSGPVILANAGLEYYVHVRHFSLGLEVNVLAPLNPTRVFVGIGPELRYTF